MAEKETEPQPTDSAPAEAAAADTVTFKSLEECCELNQAGVDVSEDVAHYLKEAIDEYGQLGAECADLYFLYGDNMLRLAQVAGKNNFKDELRRKRDARSSSAASASAAATAGAKASNVPDLKEVNELVASFWHVVSRTYLPTFKSKE